MSTVEWKIDNALLKVANLEMKVSIIVLGLDTFLSSLWGKSESPDEERTSRERCRCRPAAPAGLAACPRSVESAASRTATRRRHFSANKMISAHVFWSRTWQHKKGTAILHHSLEIVTVYQKRVTFS